MDFLYFAASILVSLVTLYVTFKYSKIQNKQYTRDSLYRLFTHTNEITNIDNIQPHQEINLRREFKRIYNLEVSIRTIHLLTARFDDYKFATQCFKYTKKITEIDNLISKLSRRNQSRFRTGMWLIIIIIYYVSYAIVVSTVGDGFSVVHDGAVTKLAGETIKSLMFAGAMPLSVLLGLSLRDMQFFDQIVLREQYLNIPVVSIVARNEILKKIDGY